jgi:hypothetical protein
MHAYNFATSYTIRCAVRLLQCDVTCRRLRETALMCHSVLPNGTHCAVFSSAGNESRLILCTARQTELPQLVLCSHCQGCNPTKSPARFRGILHKRSRVSREQYVEMGLAERCIRIHDIPMGERKFA